MYCGRLKTARDSVLELSFCRGELKANFNQLFGIIAIANEEYQRKKATSLAKSDLIEMALPTFNNSVTSCYYLHYTHKL